MPDACCTLPHDGSLPAPTPHAELRVGDKVLVSYEGVIHSLATPTARMVVRVLGVTPEVHTARVPRNAAVQVLEPAAPAWWPPRECDVLLLESGEVVQVSRHYDGIDEQWHTRCFEGGANNVRVYRRRTLVRAKLLHRPDAQ